MLPVEERDYRTRRWERTASMGGCARAPGSRSDGGQGRAVVAGTQLSTIDSTEIVQQASTGNGVLQNGSRERANERTKANEGRGRAGSCTESQH